MITARAVAMGVALCLISFRPVTARADAAKAWTAAKTNLPANTEVVVGLDVATLAKSSLFQLAFPMILAQQPDIKSGLELVKTTCKIDPLTAINGMVAGTDKEQKQGAIFIAVTGLDEAKIVTCLEAIAKAKGAKDAKVAVTKDGGITELTMGTDKLYLSWIGKDVIVMPLTPGDKAQLVTWTGGKKALAKAPVGPSVAKVDTRSAIWAVSSVERDLEGMKMKGGYGGLAMAKGKLTIDLHIAMPNAVDATTVADKATAELAVKTNGPGLAPALKPLLEAVMIKSAAAEVVIKASFPEGDLLALAGALMSGN